MKKLFLTLCLISVSSIFFAETRFTDFFNSNYFKLSPAVDSSILATGATFVTTGILLDKVFIPTDKNEAQKNFDISDVNKFDRTFMLPYSKTQDILGNVAVVAAALAPTLLLTAPKNEWGTMAAMYGESLLFSWGLKEVLKNSINRKRPYMYLEGAPDSDIANGKFTKSFPSGHTTIAFTSAAFTSYAFCTYFPESKWKAPVIALSYTLAAATGTFRITSGDHFVTDVLAGAAIGTISGLLIPWLHSRVYGHENSKKNIEMENRRNVTLSLLPAGFSVKIKS